VLILPLDRPIDWRRPPVVALLLVLANVFVYFAFQLDDGQAEGEAFEWYYESDLAAMELPRYREWLRAQGAGERARRYTERFGEPLENRPSPWMGRRLADGTFQDALRSGEVIAAGTAEFARWQRRFGEFERRLRRSTSVAHGLQPARPDAGSWFTHMFLHGGVVHLIGNMIFLLAVGFLVEMALGSGLMLGLYVLGGLGAAALFVALNDSLVPLVGASGAIAGLMGLFAVVYGLQRIRFFLFLGVYFDYVKAPAIALLPLWLGYEVYQYVAASEFSPVAYSAHIGGLVTGAAAGLAVRLGTSRVDRDYLVEREREERLAVGMDEVRGHIRALAAEDAAAALRRLEGEFSGEPRVLQLAYEAARLEPASAGYHAAARRILELDAHDQEGREWVIATYHDYCRRARPRPRLSRRALVNVTEHLIEAGDTAGAERLLRMMLRQPEHFPGLDERICRQARALVRGGETERAMRWYARVTEQWPQSPGGRRAREALARIRR